MGILDPKVSKEYKVSQEQRETLGKLVQWDHREQKVILVKLDRWGQKVRKVFKEYKVFREYREKI